MILKLSRNPVWIVVQSKLEHFKNVVFLCLPEHTVSQFSLIKGGKNWTLFIESIKKNFNYIIWFFF